MTSRAALMRLQMLSAYLTGARSDSAPLITSSTLRLPWTSLAATVSPSSANAAEAKRSSSLYFHFMTPLRNIEKLRFQRRRRKALAVLAAERLRRLAAARVPVLGYHLPGCVELAFLSHR